MRKLMYKIGKSTEEEQSRMDFLDGMSRTVEERISLGFLPIKIPIIDDLPYRIFETMEQYQEWLEKALPRYLGYSK